MESRGHREMPELEDESVEEDALPAATWSWLVAVGVFLIHLNIPSFIFSHGVLIIRLVDDNNWSLSHAFFPPFIYTASWFIADPVCRQTALGHSPMSKYIALAGVLIVTASIALNALTRSIMLQIFSFGVMAGVGTSFVLTQAEEVLHCHFPSQRGLVQAVCHTSMALGHFGMPLVLNGLINMYGTQGGVLLQAGVVLQAAVGATLLLAPGEDMPQPYYRTRPRAYTLVSDVELAEMSSNYRAHSGHSPLLPQRSWKNPSLPFNTLNQDSPVSSPILRIKHKNVNGVDILPEIPEENEDSEDTDNPVPVTSVVKARVIGWDDIELNDVNERKNKPSSPKSPLSKWRNINLQNDSRSENVEANGCATFPLDITLEAINTASQSPTNLKSSLPHRLRDRLQYYHSPFRRIRRLFCCSWFCRFKLYVTVLNIPHNLSSYLLSPFWTALKEPKFFPSCLLHTVLRTSFITFSAIASHLVGSKVESVSLQETAFTISVAAFTWLCFLLISPCFADVKPRTQKFLTMIGCLVSISGLYVLSACTSQGSIIIASAVFGLGQGAVKCSGRTFLEHELGISKYMKLQGCMDVISGCFVLVLAAIAGVLLQYEHGVTYSIITLAAFQTTAVVVWIFFLLMPFVSKLNCLQCKRPINYWPPQSDFMTPS